jgi:integrase
MAKGKRTRANSEGTIYKRGKGYCGQYHVVTRDGTKKRRSVYGKTRAEAAEKLAAAIADRDQGSPSTPVGSLSGSTWIATWTTPEAA